MGFPSVVTLNLHHSCERLSEFVKNNRRPSEGLFVESNGRSNHRFFLIMLTYHVLYEFYFDEDSGSLIALQLSWRSISDAFVTREITVPGPRSLQHLCRCSLRQRLADNHQLPEGTQNLGLPKVLKEHIDLET
ncbi:hypothetical protein NPIL_648751 [Nephila pilipes]|uniref:SOCS box domain-containing protein n=1 Tax=Nephila pilipes TaxID=299642 RepID=A0A8X6UIZ1_NEPPI|nr:hypothetical protein NPIL_648751 [Nephila pilipes]